MLDTDPYMVILDGEIKWIQSAYTVSDRFPYSQQSRGSINYIRDSVKIVVDADYRRHDVLPARPR